MKVGELEASLKTLEDLNRALREQVRNLHRTLRR